jgi:hypothetical protein
LNAYVLDAPTLGGYRHEYASDPEKCEYFVPMHWLHTVPLEKAVWEKGLFANQNTVCRPTSARWRFTVEQLKEVFSDFDKA